jgi:TRAP-type C4-dicarboxylate transport system permease small subunit
VNENPITSDYLPKDVKPDSVDEKLSGFANKIFTMPVKIMVAFGSVVIMVMMLLMTADVVGRYVLNKPILGTDELIGFLFLCLAACSFSYAQWTKTHIRIELFLERFPARTRLILDTFTYLLTFAMSSLIAWQLFVATQQFLSKLQSGNSVSEILAIPWYPFLIILGLGFSILAFITLFDIILAVLRMVKR